MASRAAPRAAPDLPTETLEVIAAHLLPARLRNMEDAAAACENAAAMLGVCRAWRTAAPSVRERFAALARTLEPARPRLGDFADPLLRASGLPPPPAWLPPGLEAALNFHWRRAITELDARHEWWLTDADLRPLRRAQLEYGPLGAVWVYAAADVKAAWRRKTEGVCDIDACRRDREGDWSDREEAAERGKRHGEGRRADALEHELGGDFYGLGELPTVHRWLDWGHGSAAAAADAIRVHRFVKRLPEFLARADEVSQWRSEQCARDMQSFGWTGPQVREVEACTVAALWAYVARRGGRAAVEADAEVPAAVKAAAAALERRVRAGELLYEYRAFHDCSGEEAAADEEYFSASWWEIYLEIEREQQRERYLNGSGDDDDFDDDSDDESASSESDGDSDALPLQRRQRKEPYSYRGY